MEVVFEWKKSFDSDSAETYIEALSTLIGEKGALKLLEVARIYEQHDWFQVLVAKNNRRYGWYARFILRADSRLP